MYMKKILLSCAAALLCIAGLAQEQQEQSNQYRRDQQNTRARWIIDTTSVTRDTIWFDAEGNRLENTADEGSQNYRQNTDTEMQRNTDQTLDTLQQDVERETEETEQRIRNEADTTEEAGREVIREMERAGNEVEREAQQTGDTLQEEAGRKANEVRNNAVKTDETTPSGSEGIQTQTSVAPDIEVVEGKEGPENQVVYKYQGEMWYVDREEKKMVKAKESDLIDTKHKVMVHEGTATNDPAGKKKSKG
jgi:hypothetical protein